MNNPLKQTALAAIAALRDVRGKLPHTDVVGIAYLDDVIVSTAELGDLEQCRCCKQYVDDLMRLVDGWCCIKCIGDGGKVGQAQDDAEAHRQEISRRNVQ